MRRQPPRLSKSEIAAELGCHRATVSRYLKMEDAPKCDSKGKYDADEAAHFISDRAPRAGEGDALKALRAEKLRLECDRLILENDLRRRDLIPRSEIAPAISGMAGELVSSLQAAFEMELPSRCVGKSATEIQVLNAAAIDSVLARFKSGGERLEEGA